MLDQTGQQWTSASVPGTQLLQDLSQPSGQSSTGLPILGSSATLNRDHSRATEKARVLHIVNGEHFAGAERVQMHLANCLPQFGFYADFACLLPGRFYQEFDIPHSRAISAPMRNRFDLGVIGRIRSDVRDENYCCIHAHTPRSAMIAFGLARRLGIPWVYHLHSPVARDSSRRFMNWLNGVVEQWSVSSAVHLIAVSNSLKKQAISDGWLAESVTVVHNGVPSVRPQRTSVPTVGGKWTLGMVALMRPRKGLEVALQALAQVRAAGHDVVLRCIGPFETTGYETAIKRQIQHLQLQDAVEMVGFTKDIPSELARLDIMVLPSLYGEGMPMVVLEAMAAGLPVVATEVEGTPEAIQHGKQGLLAQPNNPDSLAEQIELLVSGEYDWPSMGESAAYRHSDAFSDVAMAQATAAVYRKVCKG